MVEREASEELTTPRGPTEQIDRRGSRIAEIAALGRGPFGFGSLPWRPHKVHTLHTYIFCVDGLQTAVAHAT